MAVSTLGPKQKRAMAWYGVGGWVGGLNGLLYRVGGWVGRWVGT